MHLLLRFLISAMLLYMDASVPSTNTDFTPVRSVNAPYILEVYSTEQSTRSSRTTIVTFSISDSVTGELLYTCPDHWRAWDLYDIGWAKDGYNVIVDSSDVGTSPYVLSDDTWQRGSNESLYRCEPRDGYTLEVLNLDFLEEKDSIFFRIRKGTQLVYHSASRIYVDDASLVSVLWTETGLDIEFVYPDGSKSYYEYSGNTWNQT